MVVHSRPYELSERVVGPLPHPAVDAHPLRPKANRFGLKVPVLKTTADQIPVARSFQFEN